MLAHNEQAIVIKRATNNVRRLIWLVGPAPTRRVLQGPRCPHFTTASKRPPRGWPSYFILQDHSTLPGTGWLTNSETESHEHYTTIVRYRGCGTTRPAQTSFRAWLPRPPQLAERGTPAEKLYI